MFANWYDELNFFCLATFTPVSAQTIALIFIVLQFSCKHEKRKMHRWEQSPQVYFSNVLKVNIAPKNKKSQIFP